jgi:hypothetical protein
MKKLVLSAWAFTILFAFNGCDLEDPLGLNNMASQEELEQSGEIVATNANAEMNAIKVFENINTYGLKEDSKKSVYVSDDSPEVIWESLTKLILDFTDVDGASGKIIVEFSGPAFYSTPNLIADVTFENYQNQGTSLEGAMELALVAFNSTPEFTLKTNGALTITNEGEAVQWSCDQTVQWVEGANTMLEPVDDVYWFNGTAKQTQDTVTHSLNIVNTVVFDASCDYIKDGELELINFEGTDDEFKVNADFGVGATSTSPRGECDSYVELSSGAIVLIINLDE